MYRSLKNSVLSLFLIFTVGNTAFADWQNVSQTGRVTDAARCEFRIEWKNGDLIHHYYPDSVSSVADYPHSVGVSTHITSAELGNFLREDAFHGDLRPEDLFPITPDNIDQIIEYTPLAFASDLTLSISHNTYGDPDSEFYITLYFVSITGRFLYNGQTYFGFFVPNVFNDNSNTLSLQENCTPIPNQSTRPSRRPYSPSRR